MSNRIYLIGSLRNPEVPVLGNYLREAGFEVFDDWFAAGEVADDRWQAYETRRGRPYDAALKGLAARHIFAFDYEHINRADIGVLYLPAGKSGHMELGYMVGAGKKGYILMDKEPDRWDCMYQFAEGVYFDRKDLVRAMQEAHG